MERTSAEIWRKFFVALREREQISPRSGNQGFILPMDWYIPFVWASGSPERPATALNSCISRSSPDFENILNLKISAEGSILYLNHLVDTLV